MRFPPPSFVKNDAKLEIFALFIFFLFFSSSGYCQSLEPTDFDWSESFDKNVKTEFLYSSSILPDMPETAMFFVESRPREEKKSITFYVKDEHNIYARYKTLSYQINGKLVNYGLADMISSGETSHYSLMTDPSTYLENVNANEFSSGFHVGTLEESSIDITEFQREVERAGLISYVDDGKTWYRDSDRQYDIAFEDGNKVLTKNLNKNSLIVDEYAHVYEDIYRIVRSVRYVPLISVEGYCYEQKTTITNSNFEFEIKNDIQERNSSKALLDSDLKQNGDYILINNSNKLLGGNLVISDVLGRILYQETISSDRISYKPSSSGVYILAIKKDGNLFTTKLFLN